MTFALKITTKEDAAKAALQSAKVSGVAEIAAMLRAAADKHLGDTPDYEVASWPTKAAAAAAHLAGKNQSAVLGAEAALRGQSVDELAKAINAKAEALAPFVNMLAGLRASGQAAIEKAATEQQISAAVADIKAKLTA